MHLKNKVTLLLLLCFFCQISYGQGVAYHALRQQYNRSASFISLNLGKCFWYVYDYTDDNGVKSKKRIIDPVHGYTSEPIYENAQYLTGYTFNLEAAMGCWIAKTDINKSKILEEEKRIISVLNNAKASMWWAENVGLRTYSIGITTTFPTTSPSYEARITFNSDFTIMWTWMPGNPEYKEYYRLVNPSDLIPKVQHLYE